MNRALPAIRLEPGKRAQVWIPYDPDVNGYQLLESLVGLTRRGAIKYQRPVFLLARHHTTALIAGLADKFGAVKVYQVGLRTQACVEACWDANPDTWPDCVCSCHGANHGSRTPPKEPVADESVRIITRSEALSPREQPDRDPGSQRKDQPCTPTAK